MSKPAHTFRSLLTSRAAWIGLGLLGILAAAAISITASKLSSQQIGISSEPLSAGRKLATPVAQAQTGTSGHGKGGDRQGETTNLGGSPDTPSTIPPQMPTSPGVGSPPPRAPSSADEDEGGETSGSDADD